MTPAEISNLYTRLLTAAAGIMRSAAFAPGRERMLDMLEAEVDHAVAQPAEHRLIFEHERMLVQSLKMLEHGRRYKLIDHTICGAQYAGVVLPWVQEHAAVALVAQHAAVHTSDGGGGQRG